MSDQPSISVLVRTYNSEKTLPLLLSRLDLAEGDEVLVVDSGSEDKTLEVAAKFGARCLEAPLPFSYSKSLNVGFRAAKNPWVHVVSSHAIPVVPNLVVTLRKELVMLPEDVAVGYAPGNLAGKCSLPFAGTETIIFTREDYDRVSSICGNANTLYRHSVWQEIPFDESVRTSEDKIWLMNALEKGWRFACVPSAPMRNKSRYSLAYMFRKGQSDARTLRKPDHQPMALWQLAGAQKNMLLRKMSGEIDWGNWVRYSAHIFGVYSGSRMPEDNTPRTNPKLRP